MLKLVLTHDVKPEQVKAVRFRAGSNILNPLRYQIARTELEAKFCPAFMMSSLVLRRKAGIHEFTDEFVQSAPVQEMMRKVTTIRDQVIEARGFDKMRSTIVDLTDGRTLVQDADERYRGGPDKPFTREELHGKFTDCASRAATGRDRRDARSPGVTRAGANVRDVVNTVTAGVLEGQPVGCRGGLLQFDRRVPKDPHYGGSCLDLVGALIIAVTLSMVTTINVGIVCLAFAWIVGVLLGGMSVGDILGGFPTPLFVTLVGVTLLFSMARGNGTLERVTERAVRLCRGHTGVLPIMFFFLALGLSTIGPGSIGSAALLAPPAMAVAARTGISFFLMAIMIGNGALAGSLSPFSPTGVVANSVMARMGFPGLEWTTFINNILGHTLVAFGGYAMLGGLRLFRKSGSRGGRRTAEPAARLASLAHDHADRGAACGSDRLRVRGRHDPP